MFTYMYNALQINYRGDNSSLFTGVYKLRNYFYNIYIDDNAQQLSDISVSCTMLTP